MSDDDYDTERLGHTLNPLAAAHQRGSGQKKDVANPVDVSDVLNVTNTDSTSQRIQPKSTPSRGSDDRKNNLLLSIESNFSARGNQMPRNVDTPTDENLNTWNTSYEGTTSEESESLKHVKRQHLFLFLFFLVLAVVLAVGGGLAVGFVSRHFTMQFHRDALEVKNRVVLNSSVLRRVTSQQHLFNVNNQMIEYVRSIKTGFSSPATLRDELEKNFLSSWSLWLSDDQFADSFIIRVPFCEESLVGQPGCKQATVGVNCSLPGPSRRCWYFRNDDTGLLVEIYALALDDNNQYHISSFQSSYQDIYTFYPNQTNSTTSFFLLPEEVLQSDGTKHSVIPVRRQAYLDTNQIVVGDTPSDDSSNSSSSSSSDSSSGSGSGTDSGSLEHDSLLIVDTIVYIQTWFKDFDSSLQKADESYSLLFSQGYIIDYSFGKDVTPGLPCTFKQDSFYLGEQRNNSQCGTGGGKIMDEIVRYFVKKSPSYTLDVADAGSFSMLARVANVIVAYQDFIRFRTSYYLPNVIIFAAYATPLETGLGEEGVIQIVICVVVIVICVFVLGAITFIVTSQFQRVIVTVSKLASFAATYDINSMEATLEHLNKRNCLTRSLSSLDIVKAEFSRILANLKQYKLFLPQALLMNHGENKSTYLVDSDLDSPEDSTRDIQNIAPTPQKSRTVESFEKHEGEISINVEESRIMDKQNDLLNLGAFRRVKGTVMVIELSNLSSEDKKVAEVLNFFIRSVLTHTSENHGVVDVIEAKRVIVSFNCHYPVLRHQQRACLCALGIRDDFKESQYRVSIGIASGFIYVGTIGTESQRARVVTSDVVAVAQSLATLNPVIQTTILAMDTVTHECTVANVPVDIVSIFFKHSSSWKQYVVSTIVGKQSEVIPESLLVSKKILRFVRNKKMEKAKSATDMYIGELNAKHMPIPWCIRRWSYILSNYKKTLLSGYVRREILWECLEGEDHVFEVLKTSTTIRDDPKASLEPNQAARGTEITKAKAMLDERSARLSASRRIMQIPKASRNLTDGGDGDALFPVFFEDDDEGTYNGSVTDDQSPSFDASVSRAVNPENDPNTVLPMKIHAVNNECYYRTDTILGRGTFGDVYLAVDETGTFVALKMLPVTISGTDQLVREVQTLTTLRNDHIVTYDTCAVEGNSFCIITEYLAAGTIGSLIQKIGALPPKAVRRYSRDILNGLNFLHENKYNHCDLKPDNVLLTSDGICKLADFGAAVLERSSSKAGIRGTPRFMAPEAVLGTYSPAADIYSFGLTLSQMMTGKHPWHLFPESNTMFLVQYAGAIREALEKASPCSMMPELPKEYVDVELLQIVHRCCAFKPEDRPTVQEMLTLLS